MCRAAKRGQRWGQNLVLNRFTTDDKAIFSGLPGTKIERGLDCYFMSHWVWLTGRKAIARVLCLSSFSCSKSSGSEMWGCLKALVLTEK
jgi:hypothetical protein